jgi:hypothetical protein
MTSTAKDIGNKLAKLRSGAKSIQLDTKMLESMLANINKIAKKTPEKPQKEIGQMLEALDYLKEKLEQCKTRKLSIVKDAKQFHTDLVKHLTLASKGLAEVKQTIQKEAEVPDSEYKSVGKILNKTDGAVDKQIAIQRALPQASISGRTQNIIAKILEDIKFLHFTIGAQVRAGTARVQASAFRLTLKKTKDRLRVLQKLNKTRGEIAAQVEKDTQR